MIKPSLDYTSKDFDALRAEDAELFLRDVAAGKVNDPRVPLSEWFNELAYPLFLQACFADPIYGGNNGKVFWRMVGYPGLPATYREEIKTYFGKKYDKPPRSIADFT